MQTRCSSKLPGGGLTYKVKKRGISFREVTEKKGDEKASSGRGDMCHRICQGNGQDPIEKLGQVFFRGLEKEKSVRETKKLKVLGGGGKVGADNTKEVKSTTHNG